MIIVRHIIIMIKESISFSGGGYNCVYHLGIVKYIFENPDSFATTKYLGASGGAGIISFILCYEKHPNRLQILHNLLNEIINLNKLNLKKHEQVNKYSQIIESYVNQDKFNEYIKDSDRCHISVTNITYIFPINNIKTKFQDYNTFLETLRASACIPFILDNTIRTIDGGRYIDGGLSNNLPIINNNTIRISCLNYPLLRAEVYPKEICKIYNSFTSPDEKYIMSMFNLGHSDFSHYMKDHHNYRIEKYIHDFISHPDFLKLHTPR